MHVGRVMHKELVTISPDTTLVQAKEIIAEKKIAHLLVVDENDKLVGVVSDRDVKQSWASPATTLSQHELNYILTQVTVKVIMRKNVLTIPPGMTIERAASIMQENRIGSLPVVEDGKLVGIITTTDVMKVLLEAIGMDSDSFRFSVLVADRVGVVAELSNMLRDNDVSIRSLVTWPVKSYKGLYLLVMRVSAAEGPKAVEVLSNAGFTILTDYVEDLTPYLPK